MEKLTFSEINGSLRLIDLTTKSHIAGLETITSGQQAYVYGH